MISEVEQVVPDRKSFFPIANQIVESFKLKTQISDETSYLAALEELRAQASSEDKIRMAEKLVQLEKSCKDFVNELVALSQSAKAFCEKYSPLA